MTMMNKDIGNNHEVNVEQNDNIINNSNSSSSSNVSFASNVPIIDLMNINHDEVVQQITNACQTIGFFHIINHGISNELITNFRQQCINYFKIYNEKHDKDKYRRNEYNSRGYFDNEYTKQRLDWKYALDVGVPGSRDWTLPDDDIHNQCLDGYNQLPSNDELDGFRTTVIEYFEACATLSHRIATLMTEGILLHHHSHSIDQVNTSSDDEKQLLGQDILNDLYNNHTSYLRMNYYPPCPIDILEHEANLHHGKPPLGISPHRDAGFLTILLQDDHCYSLQVLKNISSNQHKNINYNDENEWCTVKPIPNGLTINTGDMAQIWSNGIYKAPLHRVLTNPNTERYSAPFFYNPGYNTWIRPIGIPQSIDITKPIYSNDDDDNDNNSLISFMDQNHINYYPCLWGYFRAIRFAGDITDLGVEIQVDDFVHVPKSNSNNNDRNVEEEKQVEAIRDEKKSMHHHVQQQYVFAREIKCNEPFSIDQFRKLFK